MKKPLQIVNASAGSGKTYFLVKEYLKLLLTEEDDKRAFEHILAMTFTNKAALEMKERIIKALDEISSKKDDQLVAQLTTDTGSSEDTIREKCRTALREILHNYEEFYVMTIDKFNLRLIKSFSRDLDLPGDFEVLFDEADLLEKVVDQLLSQLGDPKHQEINSLIEKYATSQLEEDKSWNIRNQLIDFSSILSAERNRKGLQHLMKLHFSVEEFGVLINERNKIAKGIIELLSEAKPHIESLVREETPGGKTTIGTLTGLSESNEFPTKALFTDAMLRKINGEETKQFPDELSSLLLSAQTYWESHIRDYLKRSLFLKNYFNMALLQYITEEVAQARTNERLIRISEFNELIAQLIQNEEAPYIYERLGVKFHHYLLDEFQDTSHLQWVNLLPLVRDGLSTDQTSLIVGDPKQSIYRFKNGVAEQFVELPAIYNPEDSDTLRDHSAYFEQRGYVTELDKNWRSSAVIVEFNNWFFTSLRDSLSEKGKAFYNAIKQEPMKHDLPGFIDIVSEKKETEDEELVPMIIDRIEQCKKAGYKEADICILGSRNDQCNNWAIGLNEAGYKVVSVDSLLIKSDQEVQLTIAYLYLRLNPTGITEQKRFAERYVHAKGLDYSDYDTLFEKNENGYPVFNFDIFQARYFSLEDLFFSYENLYDLIQKFYLKVEFDELSNPYIHHLADVIFEFELFKGPDLKHFLEEYERKKNSYAVQVPASSDALNIMTMHKSKGLEFTVVIIPNLDLKLESTTKFLVDLQDIVIYKQPSRSDQLPELVDLINEENDQTLIDSVNLCYVAMTRPKERLYVINHYNEKKFGRIFHDTIGKNANAIKVENTITYSESKGTHEAEESDLVDIYKAENVADRLWFPHIALQDREELKEDDHLNKEQQFGNEFHWLINETISEDEINISLERGIQLGMISKENEQELRKKLVRTFRNEAYSELFREAKQVLSEQSMLVDASTELRPDKIIVKPNEVIVVDYKTSSQRNVHNKQVLEYMHVLSTMGHKNVKGYLFYTASDELIAVR